MSRIDVGVDSGGTRTNVLIRLHGSETREVTYEVGSALSGALSNDLIRPTLKRVLAPLESRLGPDDLSHAPVHIWVSAAGFTRWTRDEYMGALEEAREVTLSGRVACIAAANDAVAILLGSGADGAVIAGTGSNVLLKSEDGELSQAGGHEWVACDQGSGFWIGLRGIREAYRDIEAGEESVLVQRLFELYGLRLNDGRRMIEKLRELAVADEDMKKEIARFASAVCYAGERGDRAAQDIVKIEAEELADVMAASLRRRFSQHRITDGLRLVQCGSLLSNSFYRTAFESQIEMRLLSGEGNGASLQWERVTTGDSAAASLAGDLPGTAERLLALNPDFRPVIVFD